MKVGQVYEELSELTGNIEVCVVNEVYYNDAGEEDGYSSTILYERILADDSYSLE